MRARRCTVLGLLVLLVWLVLTGCSSTPPQASPPAWPRASDAPSALPEMASRLTLQQANDVTLHAISLVGTPYRYGGNTPQTGFDCSGLIGYVYKNSAGVGTPRTVAALVDWGQVVPVQALRSGDLVLFTLKGVASHAGIYVGEGRFVHAPSKGGEVRLDALDSTYWARQQVSYRRP
jgi:cell wall-associated NlpC family hydrolase